MMNPFTYTKNPQTLAEARANSNYWWYESMVEPPGGEMLDVHWHTFIREMKHAAANDQQRLMLEMAISD
jgi:hypothetical protein